MRTGCPAPPPSTKVSQNALGVQDPVIQIPHIGKAMKARLNARRIRTVLQLIRHFSATPPLSAVEIEDKLSNLYVSPSRNSCVVRKNGSYQTSDVNRCAFNNTLNLLRYAHRNRGTNGIPQNINIPNASRVRMRRRGIGVGVGGKSVRFCGCKTTQQECEQDPELDCTWHDSRSAGLTRGVCTPNASRRENSGFRGRYFSGNGEPLGSQFSGRAGMIGHTVINGDIYVDRWRVPGRARRRRAPRRLSGGLADLKKQIMTLEGGGKKDMKLRRKFNALWDHFKRR